MNVLISIVAKAAPSHTVTLALDARVHGKTETRTTMDCRVKPGNDSWRGVEGANPLTDKAAKGVKREGGDVEKGDFGNPSKPNHSFRVGL